MVYKTKGVCSSAIEFEIEDDIIKDIQFRGGCQGNTTGVAALVKGMSVDEVIERLQASNAVSAVPHVLTSFPKL